MKSRRDGSVPATGPFDAQAGDTAPAAAATFRRPMLVFIDGCAVNRLAIVNLDPVKALAGTEFRVALTPELEAEYTRALDHLFVPSYVKGFLRALLERGERHGVGIHPGRGADPRLVTLARTMLVVTDDAKLYRRSPPAGMIAWPDLEAHLNADGTLVDLLRRRATAMPNPDP